MRSEWLVLIASKLKLGRKLFFCPLLFLNISTYYFSTVGWKQDHLKLFWEKEREENTPFHTCSMLQFTKPLACRMLASFSSFGYNHVWRTATTYSGEEMEVCPTMCPKKNAISNPSCLLDRKFEAPGRVLSVFTLSQFLAESGDTCEHVPLTNNWPLLPAGL